MVFVTIYYGLAISSNFILLQWLAMLAMADRRIWNFKFYDILKQVVNRFFLVNKNIYYMKVFLCLLWLLCSWKMRQTPSIYQKKNSESVRSIKSNWIQKYIDRIGIWNSHNESPSMPLNWPQIAERKMLAQCIACNPCNEDGKRIIFVSLKSFAYKATTNHD